MQQYEVQILYRVHTRYPSSASWWTSLVLGQEAAYNIHQSFQLGHANGRYSGKGWLSQEDGSEKRMPHMQDIPYVGRHPPPKSFYNIYPFNLLMIHPLGVP